MYWNQQVRMSMYCIGLFRYLQFNFVAEFSYMHTRQFQQFRNLVLFTQDLIVSVNISARAPKSGTLLELNFCIFSKLKFMET